MGDKSRLAQSSERMNHCIEEAKAKLAQCSVTQRDMMARALAAKTKMDALRAKELRSLAKVAEITCPACGRKVIVANRGFGDTLQVCEHIWNVLQGLPKAKPQALDSLRGVRIELFDDGPARF